MSKPSLFIKKHWLILCLLIVNLIGVNWIVVHKRPPGSMTVIEAQGMDMTEIKAPVGPLPVDAENVQLRPLHQGRSFPASISALNEEDVVTRVPGRIGKILVYPGDHVKAGQLLATVDAPEYDAAVRKAEDMSKAKSSEVISAERMIEHHKNLLESARATLNAALIAKSKSQTEVDTAALELRKAKDELTSTTAAREEQGSNFTYADQELGRERELYQKGAISLDEVQASRRDRDSAAARLKNAAGTVESSSESVQIAKQRLKAARQSAGEADAQIAIAKAGAGEAQEAIAQAHADANATRFEASAATADTASASAFADYRSLTAISDGIVAERVQSPGTAVAAGQVVLKLTDAATVRVQADVPQDLSDSVRLGDQVLVQAGSVERSARITSVFPNVDPQTRTFRVESLVPNLSGTLKPGMFAHLTIQGTGTEVLAVRTGVIQADDGGKFVWTILNKPGTGSTDWTCTMHPQISEKGPGKCPICAMDLIPRNKGGSLMAHRSTVTVGLSAGDYTTIVEGLKPGDQVIDSGLENLIEGTPVKPNVASHSEPIKETPKPAMPSMQGMSLSKKRAKGTIARAAKFEYVCPMDKDVVSSKPGNCPKCGMELVRREVKP